MLLLSNHGKTLPKGEHSARSGGGRYPVESDPSLLENAEESVSLQVDGLPVSDSAGGHMKALYAVPVMHQGVKIACAEDWILRIFGSTTFLMVLFLIATYPCSLIFPSAGVSCGWFSPFAAT